MNHHPCIPGPPPPRLIYGCRWFPLSEDAQTYTQGRDTEVSTPNAYIRDPDLMRLRDVQMLQMKILGNSQKDIATHFNVDIHTVERAFSRIKQEGLARLAEDKVMDVLVPAAIDRFLTAITVEGDTQAALEVLKGLNILKKQPQKVEATAPPGEEDSLLIYMRKSKQLPAETAAHAPALLEDASVHEGELANETASAPAPAGDASHSERPD